MGRGTRERCQEPKPEKAVQQPAEVCRSISLPHLPQVSAPRDIGSCPFRIPWAVLSQRIDVRDDEFGQRVSEFLRPEFRIVAIRIAARA